VTGPAISRREFLRRGGSLAFAAGAGSLLSGDLLGCGESPREPVHRPAEQSLRKCISFGSPGPLAVEGHPDDYRLFGNREYVRDVSGTTWVKLWVSWADLQKELPSAPSTIADSWRQLNRAPGGQSWLRRLDRLVRAANDDGIGVILTVFHAFPSWSNGARGRDPVSAEKPAEQKLPHDLSPDGPWGWFIAHLSARYEKGVDRNPEGPTAPASGSGARRGNPDGASVDVLEICNEPNLFYWPQENAARAVVEMVKSADRISARFGRQAVLAPATSDYPDEDLRNERGLIAIGWHRFTERVLDGLADFSPNVEVYWSQHNFGDVARFVEPSRAERAVKLLQRRDWPAKDRLLWLTEGGYNLHPDQQDRRARARQARLIAASYRQAMATPGIFMWTQHTISDKPGNNFKSGLRDDFIPGVGPGPRRPSWFTWRDLPGSSKT
jgi:hypothetical protein